MRENLKKALSGLGLLELLRRGRYFATGRRADLRFKETYIAIRKGDREIRMSPDSAENSCLPALVENFDYVHSAVVPKSVDGMTVVDFSRRQVHRLARTGTEIELAFGSDSLAIRKGHHEIRLNPSHIVYLWDLGDFFFDQDFSAVVPEMQNGIAVADYSRPRVHRLSHSGVAFEFPSLPESDKSAEAYLSALQLKPGDAVLDFGAYAGACAYFLSRAIGPEGVIGCFEPDEITFHYLEGNIARHELSNVRAFQKGLWTETTTLAFQSEGSTGSSIVSVLGRKTNTKTIDVVNLDDAAALIGGARVAAVKMDIEGAELEVVRGAGDFLRRHQPRLVIEPHPLAGNMNTEEICEILRSFDYHADFVSQGVQDWPLIAASPKHRTG